MIKLTKEYKETISYLIFGILSTIVNIATYVFFSRIIKINFMVSNIIAWFVAVIFAYITNKFFVFESKNINIKFILKEITSFMSLRILSGLTELILMYIMINIMLINDFIVKIITNIVVVILNFIFSKLIIFKNKKA